jgi:hypothetical protein
MVQYALPLSEPEAPPQAATTPVLKRRLWFCIYLPNLPLEASGPGDEARVVVEDQHGIHRVLLASAVAATAGITPGQSANAALALLPSLRIEERSRLLRAWQPGSSNSRPLFVLRALMYCFWKSREVCGCTAAL